MYKTDFSLVHTIEPISVYVVNLKKRPERKQNVIDQFHGRDEFKLNIIEGFEHSFGALGLWMSLRHIFMDLVDPNEEFIIIAEDDVIFTEEYSKSYLLNSILVAQENKADILLGGMSWFSDVIQVSNNVFWVQNFSGLHFTVVFKRFYNIFFKSNLNHYEAADGHLASLTNNILFMHPFVAIQKDFGYSDATPKNNNDRRLDTLFYNAKKRLELISLVKETSKSISKNREHFYKEMYENITIPTYIINLPEKQERLKHIQEQFIDKPEFEVTIIQACKDRIGSFGLWMTIRKIIQLAIKDEEDVIIICEDDHQFTPHYSKEYLLKNLLEAYHEGATFLSGGTGQFENAVPITENRFWVWHCLSTQFVVIFKKFFNQILDEPYDESIIADLAYSRMSLNKMILYPFISVQKDFGYSDITAVNNDKKDLVSTMFSNSDKQLNILKNAYIKYELKQYTE